MTERERRKEKMIKAKSEKGKKLGGLENGKGRKENGKRWEKRREPVNDGLG